MKKMNLVLVLFGTLSMTASVLAYPLPTDPCVCAEKLHRGVYAPSVNVPGFPGDFGL